MTASLTPREAQVLEALYLDTRGEARVLLATTKSLDPGQNRDARAVRIAQVRGLVERANAMRSVLSIVGLRGLGTALVFNEADETITYAP